MDAACLASLVTDVNVTKVSLETIVTVRLAKGGISINARVLLESSARDKFRMSLEPLHDGYLLSAQSSLRLVHLHLSGWYTEFDLQYHQ